MFAWCFTLYVSLDYNYIICIYILYVHICMVIKILTPACIMQIMAEQIAHDSNVICKDKID